MHSIVHFEIPADNLQRASEFYRKAFDWQIRPMEGYEGYNVAGPGEGGVNGAIQQRPEGMTAPLIYFGTDNIDATLTTISGLGAKITTPKSPVPGLGWFAIFRDPEGNTMAVYQADRNAK